MNEHDFSNNGGEDVPFSSNIGAHKGGNHQDNNSHNENRTTAAAAATTRDADHHAHSIFENPTVETITNRQRDETDADLNINAPTSIMDALRMNNEKYESIANAKSNAASKMSSQPLTTLAIGNNNHNNGGDLNNNNSNNTRAGAGLRSRQLSRGGCDGWRTNGGIGGGGGGGSLTGAESSNRQGGCNSTRRNLCSNNQNSSTNNNNSKHQQQSSGNSNNKKTNNDKTLSSMSNRYSSQGGERDTLATSAGVVHVGHHGDGERVDFSAATDEGDDDDQSDGDDDEDGSDAGEGNVSRLRRFNSSENSSVLCISGGGTVGGFFGRLWVQLTHPSILFMSLIWVSLAVIATAASIMAVQSSYFLKSAEAMAERSSALVASACAAEVVSSLSHATDLADSIQHWIRTSREMPNPIHFRLQSKGKRENFCFLSNTDKRPTPTSDGNQSTQRYDGDSNLTTTRPQTTTLPLRTTANPLSLLNMNGEYANNCLIDAGDPDHLDWHFELTDIAIENVRKQNTVVNQLVFGFQDYSYISCLRNDDHLIEENGVDEIEASKYAPYPMNRTAPYIGCLRVDPLTADAVDFLDNLQEKLKPPNQIMTQFSSRGLVKDLEVLSPIHYNARSRPWYRAISEPTHVVTAPDTVKTFDNRVPYRKVWSGFQMPSYKGQGTIALSFSMVNRSGVFLGAGKIGIDLSAVTSVIKSLTVSDGTVAVLMDENDKVVATSMGDEGVLFKDLTPVEYLTGRTSDPNCEIRLIGEPIGGSASRPPVTTTQYGWGVGEPMPVHPTTTQSPVVGTVRKVCQQTAEDVRYAPLLDLIKNHPEVIHTAAEKDPIDKALGISYFQQGSNHRKVQTTRRELAGEKMWTTVFPILPRDAENIGWKLLVFVPEKGLTQEMFDSIYVSIGICCGIAVAIVCVIVFLVSSALRPLSEMVREMETSIYLTDADKEEDEEGEASPTFTTSGSEADGLTPVNGGVGLDGDAPTESVTKPPRVMKKKSRTLSYLSDVAAIQQAYWAMVDELKALRGYIPQHIVEEVVDYKRSKSRHGRGRGKKNDNNARQQKSPRRFSFTQTVDSSCSLPAFTAVVTTNDLDHTDDTVADDSGNKNHRHRSTPKETHPESFSAGGLCSSATAVRQPTEKHSVQFGSASSDGFSADHLHNGQPRNGGGRHHNAKVGGGGGDKYNSSSNSNKNIRNAAQQQVLSEDGGGITSHQQDVMGDSLPALAPSRNIHTNSCDEYRIVSSATPHQPPTAAAAADAMMENDRTGLLFVSDDHSAANEDDTFTHVCITEAEAANITMARNTPAPKANGTDLSYPFSKGLRTHQSANQRQLFFRDHCLVDRTITVAVVNVVGFHQFAQATHGSDVARHHEVLVSYLSSVATRCGGVLDTFSGDKFWVSFNATSKCDHSPIAATAFAMEVSTVINKEASVARAALVAEHQRRVQNEVLDQPYTPRFAAALMGVTVGIATGRAFVGPLGTSTIRRHSIISNAMSEASALERLVSHYPGCSVMIGGDMIPAIEGYFQYLLVDAMPLPGSRGKRRRIASVRGVMCAPGKDARLLHGVTNAIKEREREAEREAAASANAGERPVQSSKSDAGGPPSTIPTASPYDGVNSLFNAFLEGRSAECRELITTLSTFTTAADCPLPMDERTAIVVMLQFLYLMLFTNPADGRQYLSGFGRLYERKTT